MKARKVLEGAAYEPHALKAICKAFDEAWAQVADLYECPAKVDEARDRLAKSVLAAVPRHGMNVEALKQAALDRFAPNALGDRPTPVAATDERPGISTGPRRTARTPPKSGPVEGGDAAAQEPDP